MATLNALMVLVQSHIMDKDLEEKGPLAGPPAVTVPHSSSSSLCPYKVGCPHSGLLGGLGRVALPTFVSLAGHSQGNQGHF